MSTPIGTIAGRLAQSGTGFDADRTDFDLLNAALRATGLDAALAAPGADLTLLAPTDGAFLSLARSLGYQGGSEEEALDAIVTSLTGLAPDGNPIPLLTDILRYHVLGEAKDRAGIAGATELETLLPGATLRPFGRTLGDGDPDADDARLRGPAVETGNGTLQAITEVLLPIDVPGNADHTPAPPSIAGLVATSGTGFDTDPSDFDILLKAVQTADLVSALDAPGADLTVFAPTDAAFVEFAGTLGYAGSDEAGAYDAVVAALTSLAPDGNPVPLLSTILLYHVVPDTLSRAQADAAGPLTTLAGPAITVEGNRIIDADPDVRDPRFVPGTTDILASNGAVQAIDRVLLPLDLDTANPGVGSTIAKQLAASGAGFDANRADFDILNAALGAAGLAATLDDGALDLTLFAPTDGAFVRLARDLGDSGTNVGDAFNAIVSGLTSLGGGDPIPLLTEILTYHVADGSLTRREIGGQAEIATLSGETLSPFGARLIDGDPTLPDAWIIGARADLEASNGVIQAIDRVLLPADITEARDTVTPPGTLAAIVVASGEGFDGNAHDFDILKAALDTAGLTAALDDPAATLTLLAPTDAAFVNLAQRLGYAGTAEAGALETVVTALTGLGNGDPLPLLTDILSYHVLDGRFSEERLRAEGEAQTLLGPDLIFSGDRIIDREPAYQVRFTEETNVLADNGALQAIDNVLLPVNLDVL
jgi:uncharacterized surface protein with fasciclin (FAS1) repeats